MKARERLVALGYDGVNNGGEEFIAFSPEQIKSATENVGTFDAGNPDIRLSVGERTWRRMEEASFREVRPAEVGRQRRAGAYYPDIGQWLANTAFSIGERRKREYRAVIGKKRPDLPADEVERFMGEVEKLGDTKREKAALHWFVRGGLQLPEDGEKFASALKVAPKFKLDPFAFASPDELLAEADRRNPKKQVLPYIDPDTVPELTNKRDLGHGVVVYDVEDSEAGQAAMRRIMNSHLGRNANGEYWSPWCLLTPTVSGGVSESAKKYWKEYAKTGRNAAFKDGKLFAFQSNDRDDRQWWDMEDSSHDNIPVTVAVDARAYGLRNERGELVSGEVSMSTEMNESGELLSQAFGTSWERGGRGDGIHERWNSYKWYFKEETLGGDYVKPKMASKDLRAAEIFLDDQTEIEVGFLNGEMNYAEYTQTLEKNGSYRKKVGVYILDNGDGTFQYQLTNDYSGYNETQDANGNIIEQVGKRPQIAKKLKLFRLTIPEIRERLYGHVNANRAKHGLPPLDMPPAPGNTALSLGDGFKRRLDGVNEALFGKLEPLTRGEDAHLYREGFGDVRYPFSDSDKRGRKDATGFVHIVSQRLRRDVDDLDDAVAIAVLVADAVENGEKKSGRSSNTTYFDKDGVRAVVGTHEDGEKVVTGFQIWESEEEKANANFRSATRASVPHGSSEEMVASLARIIANRLGNGSANTALSVGEDGTVVAYHERGDRVSAEEDAAYLDAVRRGDMESARRMVEERARLAGYDVEAFHGTGQFGFIVFDPLFSDDKSSLFFGADPISAATYQYYAYNEIAATGSQDTSVRPISTSARPIELGDPSAFSSDADFVKAAIDAAVKAGGSAEHIHYDSGMPISKDESALLPNNGMDTRINTRYVGPRDYVVFRVPQRNGESKAFIVPTPETFSRVSTWVQANTESVLLDILKEKANDANAAFDLRMYQKYPEMYKNPPLSFDESLMTASRLISTEWKSAREQSRHGIYHTALRFNNLLTVDAKGHGWKHIDLKLPGSNRKHWKTREIAKYAKEHGYDGVRIENVYDLGANRIVGADSQPRTVIIAFDSEQVKSLDPVTYDDNGNVIPLSERFNPAIQDIRFSVGERTGGRAPSVEPGGDVREAGESTLTWLRRKFVHSQTPVFDAVRRVMGVGREPPDALNVEAAAKNVHGKIRARQEMLQRAYLEPLKAILAQPGMDRKRFDDYALALHALERNRMIQERSVVVDPTTGEVVDLGVEAGSGVTNAWAERVIREIQRDPFAEQYKEAANILAEMNRFVLRGAVADGLLTEAQAKTWMRLSPHYVPLKSGGAAAGASIVGWRGFVGERAQVEVGLVFGLVGLQPPQQALVQAVQAEDLLVQRVQQAVLLGDDGFQIDDAALEGFVRFHGVPFAQRKMAPGSSSVEGAWQGLGSGAGSGSATRNGAQGSPAGSPQRASTQRLTCTQAERVRRPSPSAKAERMSVRPSRMRRSAPGPGR